MANSTYKYKISQCCILFLFFLIDYNKKKRMAEPTIFNGDVLIEANLEDPTDFGDGSLIISGTVSVDEINEHSANSGVTIEGIVFENNHITIPEISLPSNPSSSDHRLYIDSSDSILKSRDSSGVVTTYQPITTKGDLIGHSGITQIRLPVGADGFVLKADSGETSGLIWSASGGGGGETNTASNIGISGVGVFDQKVGVDLQFRNINVGSNKVTVSDDSANNEIDIDIVPGNISHNDLANLTVGDEHTQYVFLAGRSGGQTVIGGTVSGNDLIIQSNTSSDGDIIINNSANFISDTTSFSIDGSGANSNISIETTGDAQDLTFGLTGANDSSIIISSTGTGADAVRIDATSGSIDIDAATNITLDTSSGFVSIEGIEFQDNYITLDEISAPTNPPASEHRFYEDTSDNKLKSKDNSGVVTTYQPTTTKGDITVHNGTTQIRLPVGDTDNQVIVSDNAESPGVRWAVLNEADIITPAETKGYDAFGTQIEPLEEGSFGEITLDTVRTSNVIFFHSGSNGSITINENGTYLIFGRLSAEKGSSGTTEVEAKLQLNNGSWSDIPGSNMRILLRNGTVGLGSASASCILQITSGEIVRMVANLVSDDDAYTFENGSSIVIIKLQPGVSVDNNRHFEGYTNTTTTITGSYTDIPLNIERIKEVPFIHSTASAELEFNETATYVIVARATTETTTNTNETNARMRLVLDSGGGYNELPGTIAYMSSRNNSNGNSNSGAAMIVYDATLGDKIKLQCQRNVGSSTLRAISGGSGIMAVKINLGDSEDDTNYFDAYNSVSTAIGGSFTDIPLNTERKKDGLFLHTAGSSQVTVGETGLYLIYGRITIAKNSGDNTLTQSVVRIVSDIGSGFNEMQGSRGNIYSDGSLQGNTATIQIYDNLVSGTALKMQATIWDGDAFSTVSGGSGLVLLRIKSTTGGSSSSPLVIFGSQSKFSESIGLSSTTSTGWIQKVRLTTADVPAGTYRISTFYNWSHNSVSTEFQARIQIDDSVTIYEHNEEPGASSTDAYWDASGFHWVSLSDGTHTIDLDFRSDNNGDTASIRNARLEFWRIS